MSEQKPEITLVVKGGDERKLDLQSMPRTGEFITTDDACFKVEDVIHSSEGVTLRARRVKKRSFGVGTP